MTDIDLNNIKNEVPDIFCSLLLNQGYKVTPLKKSREDIEIILVAPQDLVRAATCLKMQKDTQFTLLYSVTGVDYPDKFELVYHLQSVKLNKQIVLKSHIDKNNPEIDSLSSVFSTANWHERETYDLMGIRFNNHPDLRRILLPDDWKGHPLRKDYVMDDERLVWNER